MFRKRTILLCVLLGAITLAFYWPARSFDFIGYDDLGYVKDNPNVQAGLTWGGIGWAFQTYYASNWHPLTWISLMLDRQIYGADASGFHFTNVLLHTFNSMLLFWVLFSMTGATWRSGIVAALFAWHPAHVESVAWVAERKDVLSTFFGLLALLAYSGYAKATKEDSRKATLRYSLSVFFFALSLLAKPMLVTLPFVLLLLDFWPLRRGAEFGMQGAERGQAQRSGLIPWTQLLMEKLPFFVLVFVSCSMTVWAQDSWDAMVSNSRLPLVGRVAHAMVAYAKYISMMFWPTKLAFFYPYLGTTLMHAVIALAIVVGISVAAFQRLRDAPFFSVGWFWFLGTLVPVIGIVQVGGQAMADRYTYFPYIGLFVALVWGAAQFCERWKPLRIVLNCGVLAVLAACLVVTSIQLRFWRNSFTLCEHALKVTGQNFVADCVMAEGLERAGKYAEAIDYAKRSLTSKPDYFSAQLFLGEALLETGKLDEAVASLSQASQLQPNAPIVYQKLGRAQLLKGRLDDAIEAFSSAAKLNPGDFFSESQIGIICAQKRDFVGAIQHYRAALALAPNQIEALNNLAWIRAANADADFRNGAEAVDLARRACNATGDKEPVLLGTLAAAYAEAGDFTNAVATASKARELALSKNDKATADNNEKLLKLYRAGHAYHEGDAF